MPLETERETESEMANQADLEIAEVSLKSPRSNLWQTIGFHRPLAGFWYNLAMTLLHIMSASVATILLFPIMFPYPQIDGYYQAGTKVFLAIFTAFDLGVANMMGRFIGENSIKNPSKMIKYIQYFIWYQMFSGLVQVTAIAIWLLLFPPQSLVFILWVMLVFSTTQYPAMQNVFKSALESLQQFNKSTIIGFIQGDVFQRLTEIGFVILFRYTVGQNPQVGTILAASIGLCIGKYLDDFIAMAVGMYYFSKAMKPYGVTVRDCFGHDFGWGIVKECLYFGFKTGIPGTINSFVGLLVLTWWLNVPQYTTFIALLALAESIVNFIKNLKINLGGAISESYLNDKKKLCQYYVGQTIRFDGLIQLMFYMLIIVVSFVLEPALLMIGLDTYIIAIPFILPTLVRRFFFPYEELASKIITGTDHPNVMFIIEFIAMGLNILNWWLILVVWQVPQDYGVAVIIWIMPMGDIIVVLFKLVMSYGYIQLQILRIKFPVYQSFIGPGITASLLIAMGYLAKIAFFDAIQQAFGTLVALIALAIPFFLLSPVLYFMITGFLGVWDEDSMSSFERAIKMAPIVKFLTIPLHKALVWGSSRSRLQGRFAQDYSEALEQAEELNQLKSEKAEEIEIVRT